MSAAKRKAGREIRCPVCHQRAIVPGMVGDGRASIGAASQPPPLEVVDAILLEEDVGGSSGPPPLPGAYRGEEPQREGRPAANVALPPRDAETVLPTDGRSSRPIKGRPPADPAYAYRPDAGKIQTCRWLGFFLTLVVVFSTYPAWEHVNLRTAPDWVRVVWLVAALQVVYILWMLAAPDWASLWVLTLVFALVAAAYGTATAIAMAAPLDRPMPLDMDALREAAPPWCGSVLLFSLLAAYLCGNTSVRWRRSFELQMGDTARSP